MIIDVHGHIGTLNFSPIWTIDAAKLETWLAFAGVDYCAVSSANSLIYDVHAGNLEILDAVDKHPRILGYMVGNPAYPTESIEDLKRIADHPRLVGCKMHPDYHGYNVASVGFYKFMEQAARYANVFLFHSSVMAAADLAAGYKIVDLAREHPEATFILAHAAGLALNPLYPYHPNYVSSIDYIMQANLPNVYIDIANGAILTYPTVFETVVEKIGAERILFASDVPIIRASRLKSTAREIRELDITEEAKDRILYQNALEIFATAGVHVEPIPA